MSTAFVLGAFVLVSINAPNRVTTHVRVWAVDVFDAVDGLRYALLPGTRVQCKVHVDDRTGWTYTVPHPYDGVL